MSRKSWGRGLLDILRQLGVHINKKAEEAVEHEREVDPDASTADIITRLSLAPPEVVQKAVLIAKEEGSTEVLHDQFMKARVSVQEARQASMALSNVAASIAKK
ncbi:hypothetical protein Rctr197k_059 [Virus Rctr197k]|nr:hypothetical protein Rctr197k_059 [Virus Rctr197k]